MKNASVRMYLKGKQLLNNEKGAQSLEWLGIAALLIMIISFVSAYMGGEGKSAINGLLGNIIQKIKDVVSGA